MSEILPTHYVNGIPANGPESAALRSIVDDELRSSLGIVAEEMGGSGLACQVILWPAGDSSFTAKFYKESADGYLWIQASSSAEVFQ